MSEFQKKPEIVIFAGPNGSGKSTFTQLLKPPMDYINADEIKKYLKCSDLEAAQLAEKQREEHLEKMQEFCFETVLSTERNLKLLKRAKEKGYFIRCYYILTADSMIKLVKDVVKACDICHIYDNSDSRPFRIFKKRKEQIYFDECVDWQYEDICALSGISNMERKCLN